MPTINCVVCGVEHPPLPEGMPCPNIRARCVARHPSTCQLPSCRQRFVVGVTPIAPAGNGQWCHVHCCVAYEIAKFNATDRAALLRKVDEHAIDETEAAIFRERLSDVKPTVLSGVPGSGKSSHAARFTILCDANAVAGMVYNAAACTDLVSKGVVHASTFHSLGLGAVRSTINSFMTQSGSGTFGDRVDIDYPAMVDESDEVSVQISQVKIHAFINARFPPPPGRTRGPHERKAVLYSFEAALFTEAVSLTYTLGLQNCIGLDGFGRLDDPFAWGTIIDRYKTDENIERLFESGLSLEQQQDCLLKCPDAESRAAFLSELTAWVAMACQTWLSGGFVEGMSARPWYWNEELEQVELSRGKILYVEAIYLCVLYRLPVWKVYRSRIFVDEAQDMTPLYFEFLKMAVARNNALRQGAPEASVDFYMHMAQSINYYRGAFADAATAIKQWNPEVRFLRLNKTHRLPTSHVEYVMRTVVEPHADIFMVNGETEDIVCADDAIEGKVCLNSDMSANPPDGRMRAILARNNKEVRGVFNMLMRRDHDVGLRYEQNVITVRNLLLDMLQRCEKLGRVELDTMLQYCSTGGSNSECKSLLRRVVWKVMEAGGDGLAAAAATAAAAAAGKSGLDRVRAYVEANYAEKPSTLLCTGHSSKGLEFDVVMIVNMSAIPSRRALEEGGEKLAQEYKLKYVMLTRSKDELHICAEPKEGQSLEDVLFPKGGTPEAAGARRVEAEDDLPPSPPSKKARGAEAIAAMAHSADSGRKEAAKAAKHDVALALETFKIGAVPTTKAELDGMRQSMLPWLCEEGEDSSSESSATAPGVTKEDVERAYKVLRRAILTRGLWPTDAGSA